MIITKSKNVVSNKVSYRFLVNSKNIFPTAKPEFSVLVLNEDSKVIIDDKEYKLYEIMPNMNVVDYIPKTNKEDRIDKTFKELKTPIKKVLNK